MDEARVKGLIKTWRGYAQRQRDPISRFVFLWICFNAWLSYESKKTFDRAMVNWLKSDRAISSHLKSSYDVATGSDVFRGYLRALVALSPIQRTGHRHGEVRIAGPDDFSNILEAVYQIRCSLFHGSKRANDPRDQKLVTVSGRILEKWVGNLVTSWK